MSKQKFNRINSISDIDLSKVHLGNIDERYIDQNGNRFATKFNIRTRQLQIVRIALGTDEAISAKGKVIPELVKRHHDSEVDNSDDNIENAPGEENMETQPQGLPGGQTNEEQPLDNIGSISLEDDALKPEEPGNLSNNSNVPEWIVDLNIQANMDVDVESFAIKLPETIRVESERLMGIIGNLKNANILERAEGEHDPYIELTNIYDHEVQPPFQEAAAKLEEMIRFPKEVHDYETLVDHKTLKRIDSIGDQEKMPFLKAFIVGKTYLNGLQAGIKLLKACEVKTKQPSTEEKGVDIDRALKDAVISIDYVRNTFLEEIANVCGWMLILSVY